ncbi:MAG: hypothetical protein PHV02_16330 [Rhodocyclaceae bacterium]|nr:hypothetical protein [Rhodocyclaceae bacterium]
MTTTIEYALMAGASYISNRPEINRIPAPGVWLENIQMRTKKDSGFEATYFVGITNELVISFAGTDFTAMGVATTDFVYGNIPLASGLSINGADQLVDAVEYFLTVKAANPTAHIVLTGHSLGGSLAALVGVFFGIEAHTFDQVPAHATATTGPANLLYNALLAKGHTSDQLAALSSYIQQQQTSGGIPNEALVTNINVNGEVAGLIPAPRIGSSTDIWQQNNLFPILGKIDLHSIALLTTFLQSGDIASATEPTATTRPHTLGQVSYQLPDLLKMIFDPKLYAFQIDDAQNENFLERLVRHQAGVQPDPTTGSAAIPADAMVTRFTADLWKIAQDGGLSMSDWGLDGGNHNVSQALIAFAMEKYYSEQAGGTGAGTPLFQGVSGGIQFDTSAVVGNGGSITSAKGYTEYFRQYLTQVAPDLGAGAVQFTAAEQQLINAALPQLRDWYVQAGATSTGSAPTNRGAFMFGVSDSDAANGYAWRAAA